MKSLLFCRLNPSVVHILSVNWKILTIIWINKAKCMFLLVVFDKFLLVLFCNAITETESIKYDHYNNHLNAIFLTTFHSIYRKCS